MNFLLTKAYTAGAAIGARRIVKPGASDGVVILAAAVGDASIGVTTDLDAATGETVDVVHIGIVDIVAGGTITRGALLTSDANGAAVAVSAATDNKIGRALKSAAAGDYVPVLLAPSV